MAKRIKIKNHYTLEQWQELIPKNQNLDVRFRMLVIEKILNNPSISSKEICKIFYIASNTFFRWLKWYLVCRLLLEKKKMKYLKLLEMRLITIRNKFGHLIKCNFL